MAAAAEAGTAAAGVEAAAACARLARQNARLATGGLDGTVRLWNADNGEEQSVLYGDGMVVQDVAFSADGKHLISGGADGAVRVVSLDPQELQRLALRRITPERTIAPAMLPALLERKTSRTSALPSSASS